MKLNKNSKLEDMSDFIGDYTMENKILKLLLDIQNEVKKINAINY